MGVSSGFISAWIWTGIIITNTPVMIGCIAESHFAENTQLVFIPKCGYYWIEKAGAPGGNSNIQWSRWALNDRIRRVSLEWDHHGSHKCRSQLRCIRGCSDGKCHELSLFYFLCSLLLPHRLLIFRSCFLAEDTNWYHSEYYAKSYSFQFLFSKTGAQV